jgi:hypothetical protein
MGRSGWRIYAIIHFTTFILFKSRKLHKQPLRKIAKAILGLVRSLLFSATYGYWITWSLCYVTKLNRGRITGWNSTIMAFFALPSLYLEQRGRRNEIVMYLVPRTLESLKIWLEKRKLLPVIPYFMFLLSSFTWAIISDTHADRKYPMKKTFKQILDFLLGYDEEYDFAKIIKSDQKLAPEMDKEEETDATSDDKKKVRFNLEENEQIEEN